MFALASDDIADVALAVSCPAPHLTETKAVLIEVAQRDFYQFSAIGGDDVLLRNQLLEVFADGFLDALVMADTVFEGASPEVPRDF